MLEALRRDPVEFAALAGSPAPAGWPETGEGIDFMIDRLRDHPAQADWWLYLFFDDDVLVGSGGYAGPPDDGVVEIGYEIAPEHRGRGCATAAARALIDTACATADVHTVRAHTPVGHGASTSVLRGLGFAFVGEVPDAEEGVVWRWERVCPDTT